MKVGKAGLYRSVAGQRELTLTGVMPPVPDMPLARGAPHRLVIASGNIGLLGQVAADLPWECQVAGEDGRRTPGRMWERLARASIFVHPARYEPFGIAPLEAAMSGCALVLGDIPSLREVWGDAAAYVNPDDADGLRRVLTRLIDDSSEREGDMQFTSSTKWRRWMVTREILSFITSGNSIVLNIGA